MITKQLSQAMATVQPFMSLEQFKMLSTLANDAKEAQFYQQQFIDLAEYIEVLPETYEQDGQGDEAIVYLHYFCHGSHWFIIEKDIARSVKQMFGYAFLNGDVEMAKSRCISIEEITQDGAQLDLYFVPCSLGLVKEDIKKMFGDR